MSCSTTAARAFAVPGLLIVLIIAVALSLLIGAKPLPFSVVLDAFTGTCQSADCTIVLDARLPRTLAGLLAGGAVGAAGAYVAQKNPKEMKKMMKKAGASAERAMETIDRVLNSH